MGAKDSTVNSVSSQSLDRDLEKDLEIQPIRSPSRNSSATTNANRGARKDEEDDMDVESLRAENDKGVLSRALTKISSRHSNVDPGPPPDGGLNAWTQVVLSHLVTLNTWGFVNSFGVFQTYYVTALRETPSTISWIGSIQVFLLFFIGTFTGRLVDAGYFRQIFIIGTFFSVFGIFMASLSTEYWQLFLAQGLCCGLGNGCLFCPAISLLGTYFSRKRSLALGIAAAGSATGGMLFPAMVEQLLPQIGFAWTMRSLGFIQLGLLILCIVGMKQRITPRKTGSLVDWKSFKEAPYSLFAISMFFNFWAVYISFYFIESYGTDIVGIAFKDSVNLLITLNGLGVVARILPNHLADRYFGPMNTMIPIVFATAILNFCWIAVKSRGGLYTWTVVYGLIAPAIQSLFTATIGSLTSDLRMMGTRMGMIFTIVSFATLTGPPIAGQLIQLKGGQYLYAQIFSGASLVVGLCFMLAARIAKSREMLIKF